MSRAALGASAAAQHRGAVGGAAQAAGEAEKADHLGSHLETGCILGTPAQDIGFISGKDTNRLFYLRFVRMLARFLAQVAAIIDACYCAPTTQVSKMRIRGGLS
jgi:hypothetical protein